MWPVLQIVQRTWGAAYASIAGTSLVIERAVVWAGEQTRRRVTVDLMPIDLTPAAVEFACLVIGCFHSREPRPILDWVIDHPEYFTADVVAMADEVCDWIAAVEFAA
jgi:hypothetical protein